MASEQSVAEEAPFYVRWGPEHSRFAIELKLELVSKISEELSAAERQDVEIGGLLLGSVLGGPTPTFRIEEIQVIPRPENGAIYVLGPVDQERFAEARRREGKTKRKAVGFFRSHCRPGPLKPALTDRTVLAAEFKQAPYVLLLIQSGAPRPAAFFVAQNGALPVHPSVREFRFNEAEFKALPEVEAEPGAGMAQPGGGAEQIPRRWYAWVSVGAVLFLAIALWFGFWRPGLPGWLGTGSRQLDLRIVSRDHLLTIWWNHDARQIGLTSSATLEIVDGENRRELKLGADELKLGSVEYERAGPAVQVTMTVTAPNASPTTQSARWGPG